MTVARLKTPGARPAFEIDKKGLARILTRRGIHVIALELVQNAFDEDGVTHVAVGLISSGNGTYDLTVSDDSPNGFRRLSDAYTLFAESYKGPDSAKRGRFNLGEKLVIAACTEARITTTTGTVKWNEGVRRHSRIRSKSGTTFQGTLRMTHAQAAEAVSLIRQVIVPGGIDLYVNHARVEPRPFLAEKTVSLPTEVADAEGFLRRRVSSAAVRVVATVGAEGSWLYELGIPVVPIDCPWHVDVRQRVPLNIERDNVTPGYLRQALATVLDLMGTSIKGQEARAPWVAEALESPDVGKEAVQAVIRARFGDKVVVADPSDTEATKRAAEQGYAVIQPGTFSANAWDSIRRSEAALPAGQVTPTPKPFHPNGEPLKMLDPKKVTPSIDARAKFCVELGGAVLGYKPTVTLANDFGWPFAACFGESGQLVLNVSRLGYDWFDREHGDPRVLSLLIHEFAHDRESDHLSAGYHDALCDVGAKVAEAALSQPELFRRPT